MVGHHLSNQILHFLFNVFVAFNEQQLIDLWSHFVDAEILHSLKKNNKIVRPFCEGLQMSSSPDTTLLC